MEHDLLLKAKAIAVAVNAGQRDKTGQPFIDHLRRVAEGVGGREHPDQPASPPRSSAGLAAPFQA